MRKESWSAMEKMLRAIEFFPKKNSVYIKRDIVFLEQGKEKAEQL